MNDSLLNVCVSLVLIVIIQDYYYYYYFFFAIFDVSFLVLLLCLCS